MALDSTRILDLTKDVPRSPFEQLDGIAWLPRLIDKVRAGQAGTLGDYDPYPGHGDKAFLKHFGLQAEALAEVIRSGASDEEVAAWVHKTTKCSPAEIAAYAQEAYGPSPKLFLRLALRVFRRKARAKFEREHPGLDFERINSFAKLLCLEEGHPILGL